MLNNIRVHSGNNTANSGCVVFKSKRVFPLFILITEFACWQLQRTKLLRGRKPITKKKLIKLLKINSKINNIKTQIYVLSNTNRKTRKFINSSIDSYNHSFTIKN